jgi:DNA-binding transcriptional MerR regulator
MAKTAVTKPRAANGGITAPKTAAKGPTTPTNQGGHVYVPKPPPNPYATPSAGLKQAAAGIAGTDFSGVHAAATPAAPYKGTPWDSAEQLSVAGADAKYNNALLNSGYKRTAYEQEYGLDPGYNDYKANPYSRAALLEKTYQRSQRASGNSLAAAGQLYSGASQNAETYNREHKDQERNALEATYRKALQGVTEEETGALNTREEEKANAKWKAVEAAGNAPLEPDASPAGTGGGNGGGAGSRSNNSNKNGKPVSAKRFAAAFKKGKK